MTTDAKTSSFFFTYCPCSDGDIQQGDILKKTAALSQLLEQIHPFYKNDDYTHFIVLTQSCDLVRRDGKEPKARYITLAAVRPLQLVLERELEKYQNPFSKCAMVCKVSARERLSFFVSQLLNNNSSEYFYLHSQPEVGFVERSCAFLRLSVSIKASLHYKTCYEARLLSLNSLFQAKLGWLVGNLYSRVGTDDWVPKQTTQAEFEAEVEGILEEICQWVDDKRLKASQATAGDDISAKSRDELRRHIHSTKIPRRKEELLKAIVEVVTAMGKLADQNDADQLRRRLSVHPIFEQFSK